MPNKAEWPFRNREKLKPEQFLRVHKSYIVAISKVKSFENSELLIGEEVIPISRANKDFVKEKLLGERFLGRGGIIEQFLNLNWSSTGSVRRPWDSATKSKRPC